MNGDYAQAAGLYACIAMGSRWSARAKKQDMRDMGCEILDFNKF